METKGITPKIWKKVMKITLTQMLLSILFTGISFAHNSLAQGVLNQKMTINVTETPVKKVLSQIEKELNVRFSYSTRAIGANRKINLSFTDKPLAKVLEDIFKEMGVQYELVGARQIILAKTTPSVSETKPLDLKENKPIIAVPISGTVLDEKGQSIIGASVVLKGTNKGTVTDADGKFSFNIDEKDKNGIIVISFVGFESQEIALNGQTSLNITLKEGAALDEVVVTGVFDKRTRMESSVAISVLSTKQMERISVGSAADLLKNIPGVFVNSSLGEIRNTVYSRGVSVGSNDGASGYFYVSMQEDGLPVTNATYGNYGPDYFLRPDATLGRLEAVRGGTASILGNNAPGGIFNYVSKTGGQTFEGEFRAKFGLEGKNNPYYRSDFNVGGPLSSDKTLTYNVGSFWRQSDGARYPGYPMNNGGQVKANIVKQLKGGSLKLYAKYLNDKNAWFEFLPTKGFDKPTLPAGFEQTNSVLIPPVSTDFTINDSGEKRTYDSRDKIHSTDASIGLNYNQSFGKGWTFDNKMRYSGKSAIWNTTAIAYPFDVSNLIWYAINGQLGSFGNYSFKDAASGTELANISQLPNIINGQFAGFNFIKNKDNLPGASAQPTSVLFNPLLFADNNMKEFINQATITKKLDNMSFTAGLFYANSILHRLNSFDAGVMYSQLTSPRPAATTITYTDFGGKTFKLTNSAGIAGGSGKSAATNIQDVKQNQTALFFGHNWAITPALNFDWGIRYESFSVSGTNQVASSSPTAKKGGIDGDTTTLYDQTEGKITSKYTYNKPLSTFSFSGGLNYKFSDNMAVYGRYSQGSKAPDMDMYINVNSDATLKFLNPLAQKTQQIEVGFKAKTGDLNLFVTPFYSILSNVPTSALGQETADISTTYSTPVLYNKFVTKGIELEGNYNFTKEFSVKAVATFQSSTAVDYSIYDVRGNGRKDDTIVSFSGNETDNNARTIIRISPTYTSNKFFASLDWSYMGKRAANVPNAFSLPAFNQTNLNLGYSVTPKIQVQVNVNNVFNQDGVMGWSAPGGFPAALNRQGFTKAQLDANPNAVYSTLSLPPRAYFLTVSYKF
ncbi:MAG: TonB-dependent receptor [Saprospiraceae bacterium]|nr:TonB-dependent receptor [Saprospiraceae bacterium]